MNPLPGWRSLHSLYPLTSKSSESWQKTLLLMTAMIPSLNAERLAAQVPPIEVKPPSGQQQPELRPLPPLLEFRLN